MYPSRNDRWLRMILASAAFLSGGLIVVIFGFLMWQAWPAIFNPGIDRVLTDATWHPTSDTPSFGAGPMLLASLLVTLGAVAWATPIGIGAALFVICGGSRIAAAITTRAVELLAGVPSVVFGFWGLISLVPLISRWQPPGQSLLAGVLVLGLMIVPTIALTSLSALKSVPPGYLAASKSLGLGPWFYARHVAIPTARAGIVGGIVLALARAIGETMAVLMVCGNVVQVPSGLLDPVRTITANIALEMGDDTEFHRSVLFLTGLLLMVVVTGMLTLVAPLRADNQRDGCSHA